MGCMESKHTDVLEYLRARFPKTLSILELQGYSKLLAEQFIRYDRNGNQHLSVSEFLAMCKLSRNRVSERLFALCDMDGNATLDFRELCFAVWQLCTLDHRGLMMMLFDLYDEYQNGFIETDDMERLLGDAYGAGNLDKPEIAKLLDMVTLRKHMNRLEFVDFCARTPQVMKQIIDMQRSMRTNVLGISVWERLTRKRAQKTDPVFRPENWSQLMERIILMDIDARAEKLREAKEQEARTGKKVHTIAVNARSMLDTVSRHYEK